MLKTGFAESSASTEAELIGFYTLGVQMEIEGMIGVTLRERFDLVFGTSIGAIIAALIALGLRVDDIRALYKEHVPKIMRRKKAPEKSQALAELAKEVFGDKKFDAVKTGVEIRCQEVGDLNDVELVRCSVS